MQLKLALIGYGRMGKAVEQEALQRGHEIIAKIDKDNRHELDNLGAEGCDAVIEFTHPQSFEGNFEVIIDQGLPLLTGTTGWYEDMDKYRRRIKEKEGAFLYASNFSIGVNMLFKLNRRLARLMNPYQQYDPFIEEQHHRYKSDGPSGTAHTLARDLIERLDRKSTLAGEDLRDRAPREDELSVGFVRSGEIIGRHKVSYHSEIDSLSIEHVAHNRRGFALGAVVGAEWLADKKGFYEFIDIL